MLLKRDDSLGDLLITDRRHETQIRSRRPTASVSRSRARPSPAPMTTATSTASLMYVLTAASQSSTTIASRALHRGRADRCRASLSRRPGRLCSAPGRSRPPGARCGAMRAPGSSPRRSSRGGETTLSLSSSNERRYSTYGVARARARSRAAPSREARTCAAASGDEEPQIPSSFSAACAELSESPVLAREQRARRDREHCGPYEKER